MGEKVSVKDKKVALHSAFNSSIAAYKECMREDNSKGAEKMLLQASQYQDEFAVLVKDSGKYGTILAKMSSNILNIDRGTKSAELQKEGLTEPDTKSTKPKVKKKATKALGKAIEKAESKAPSSDDL